MGLLEDAIREHMELKRRRGADPSLLARQEQDALGPVVREPRGTEDHPEGNHGDFEPVATNRAPVAGDPALAAGDPAEAEAPAARGPDFANIVQETAELDMRTVLSEQAVSSSDHAQPREPAGAGDGAPGEDGAPVEDGEPVEDVLEETPEFLRDTPEQERLWFEQQPPRDFDFDK
jgi:hypothetical protein